MLSIWALIILGSPIIEETPSDRSKDVVVTGHLPSKSDPRDETASITVIVPSKVARARTSAGLILENSLGARVRSDGSVGRRETLQLRGAGGQQIAVYIDDIRLTSGRGGPIDLSTLPLAAADEIEVVRGAASAAYGSSAQGGILRLRTGLKKDYRHQMSARTGSFGLYQIDANTGGRISNFDGFISTRYDRGNGEFPYVDVNGSQRRRVNNAHERVGTLARGRWTGSRGQTVTVLLDGLWDQRGEPGSSQFPNEDAYGTEKRLSMALSAQETHWQSGHLAMGLVSDLTMRTYELRDPNPSYQPESGAFTINDYTTGLTLNTTWDGSRYYRPQLLLEGRFESASTDTPSAQPNQRDESRTRLASTLSLSIYPQPQWVIQGILRVDGRSGRSYMLVPKLGLSWSRVKWLTIQGNIGRFFRDPSFDELYFRSVGISGNPNLQPEDGLGLDLGLRLKTNQFVPLRLEITGFQQTYRRLILFLPIDAYRVRASDELGAVIRGMEAGVQLGKKNLWSTINYLFQTTQSTTATPTPLPYRPTHRVSLGVGFASGVLQPFIHWSVQSSMTSDRFAVRRLPAYQKLDIGVRYVPKPPWSLTLEVRNATNQTGAFDAVHQPIVSRAFFLELRWSALPNPRS